MSQHLHRRSPDLLPHVSRPPTVEQITVLVLTFARGEGCCDEDPVRECVAYYHNDGRLIHVVDQWAERPNGPA